MNENPILSIGAVQLAQSLQRIEHGILSLFAAFHLCYARILGAAQIAPVFIVSPERNDDLV
jgi:hypothetical protein